MSFPKRVYIVAARRSPIGRFGGGLAAVPAAELGLQVAHAAVPLDIREAIGHVVLGQVLSAGTGMNVARQVGLRLNLPESVPAFTVNMVCGSGLKAVALGAQQIMLGESAVVLTGGVESMSNAPHYSTKTRFGNKLGDAPLLDAILADGLTDPILSVHMGQTAEKIASCFNITRAEQDEFATESQRRAEQGRDAFAREIVSITAPKGTVTFDEQPRPGTSVDGLATLRPAFTRDGTVTAGNASTINDGAAMVLLASAEGCARFNLQPLAEITGFAVTGCTPEMMGLGPITAVKKLCDIIGWDLQSVDAVELNEAFAAQSLACIRELGLSADIVNQRGGAIALGHPIGASGARILVTLLHLMEDRDYTRGIATLCIGGGMGIAMAIQRPVTTG
jgi:acetyl-CoA C-acetyltransferase